MTIELQPEFPHRTRKREKPLSRGAREGVGGPLQKTPSRTSSCTPTRRTRSSTGVAAGRARRQRRRARLSRTRAHRPRRGLRLARVRARGQALRRASHHRRRADARGPLARDRPRRDGKGYANLCRLITAAHAQTRPEGKETQPAADPALDQRLLEELNDGLVCLSGCARHGVAVRNPNAAARLARAFGSERFFVELQRPYERGDARRNAGLRDLAESLGVPTIVTGDVHAHHPRRAPLQDVLVAIRHRSALDGCEAERRGNHECVLLSPAEMVERFPEDRAAVTRTVELAERLRFDLTEELGYRYPDFSDSPEPAIVQLAHVCNRTFEERYPPGHRLRREARARLEDELKLIDELGLAGFFLLHWDVLELARECALEVRGRDSPRHALPPGPRPRLLGRLARLLPHRSLARRPGRRGALARPLPQPRARVGPGHRPRLPA